MDHHCYLLNCCVGGKNYKYFLCYSLFSLLNSIIALTFCCLSVYYYWQDIQIRKKSKDKKLGLIVRLYLTFPLRASILLIIALGATPALLYLVCYHLFLINKDETTIERRYPSLKIKKKDNKIMNKSLLQKIKERIEINHFHDIYWLD